MKENLSLLRLKMPRKDEFDFDFPTDQVNILPLATDELVEKLRMSRERKSKCCELCDDGYGIFQEDGIRVCTKCLINYPIKERE